MRKNLEVAACISLLEKNYIGHLGYISGNQPFVIPITYFYDKASHTITSYSSEGHKLDAMRKNAKVCLEVNAIQSVANWESVLVLGTFEELSRIDAKHMLHEFSEGIKNIIKKTTAHHPKFISDFSAKIDTDETTIVFRITINELIGKVRVS